MTKDSKPQQFYALPYCANIPKGHLAEHYLKDGIICISSDKKVYIIVNVAIFAVHVCCDALFLFLCPFFLFLSKAALYKTGLFCSQPKCGQPDVLSKSKKCDAKPQRPSSAAQNGTAEPESSCAAGKRLLVYGFST